MQARTFALVLVGLTLWLPRAASAHFVLLTPPSFTTEKSGKGAPPCGATSPLTNMVTKVKGGQPLKVSIMETVPHPGHYRIALLKSHSDPFPDPNTVVKNGSSVSAPIENPPTLPVLADGVWVHTDVLSGPQTTMVTIPNIDCPKCVLQVIEFMAEHGPNVGGGYYYHHCADLEITADGTAPPPPDAGTDPGMDAGSGGADGSGGASGDGGSSGYAGQSGEGGATASGGSTGASGGKSGGGSGGKSGGKGGSSASAGGSDEGGDQGGGDSTESKGCALGGTHRSAPVSLGGAILVGLALLRARRRK